MQYPIRALRTNHLTDAYSVVLLVTRWTFTAEESPARLRMLHRMHVRARGTRHARLVRTSVHVGFAKRA